MVRVGKATCNVCGKDAKFHQDKKWWCGYRSLMGDFNIQGYCKSKEPKGKNANSNT